MNIKLEIDKETLKLLVVRHIEASLGSLTLQPDKLEILTKSKQNYKAEWEVADFKAVYNADVSI